MAQLDGKKGARIEAQRRGLEARLAEVQEGLDAAPGYEAAVADVERISKEIAGLNAAEEAARGAGDDARVTANAAALIAANEALAAAQERVAAHAPSGTSMTGDAAADKLVVDVRGGEGGKLLSGDVSGPVTLSVSAGPIKLPAIDYFGTSMRLQMSGGSAATLTCTANATFQKLPGHPNELIAMEIEQLLWPRLEGQDLLLTLPVGGEMIEIGLPTAEMNGLAMSCVHLNGLSVEAFKTASGRVDVGSVKATLGDKLPYGLKGSGELKLENLWAEGLTSGALNFGLGALDLEDLGITRESATEAAKKKAPMLEAIIKRGGHVRHAGKLSLGGSYDRKKGTLAATVGLDDLAISNLHYAGGGAKVDVGDAQISGVFVTVQTKIGADGLEYVHLDRLFVKRLAGTAIGYEGTTQVKDTWPDGSERVRTSTTAVGFDKGTLHDLDVRGLKGGGYQIDLEQGSVEGLRAHVKADGFDVLQAHLDAQIDKLSVRMVEDDVTVDLDHGYVAGSIDMGDHGRDGTYKHVEFHGVGVDETKVGVDNVGKEDQRVAVHTKEADAYEIGFADGLAWNGNGRISALGEAHLKDVSFYQGKEGTALSIGSGDATIKRWDYDTKGVMKGEDKRLPHEVPELAPEDYKYTWNPGKLQKGQPAPTGLVNGERGWTQDTSSRPTDIQWKLDVLRKLNGAVELTHPNGEVLARVVLRGRTGVDLSANARSSSAPGKVWNGVIAQGLVDYMEWVDFNIAAMVEGALNNESTVAAADPGPKRFEALGRTLTRLYPTIVETLVGRAFTLSLADGLAGVGVDDLWQWGYEQEVRSELQEPGITRDDLRGWKGDEVPPGLTTPGPTEEQKDRARMVTFVENFLGTRFSGTIGGAGAVSATDLGAPLLEAQAHASVTLGGTLREGLTTGVTAGVRDLTCVSGRTRAGVGTATVTANATTNLDQRWNDGVRREVEDAELASTGDVEIAFTALSFSMASAEGEDPAAAAAAAQARLRGGKVPAKAATVGAIKRKE